MVRTFFIYLAILFAGILFFASMVLFAIPAIQESDLVLPEITISQNETGEAGPSKESLEKDINKLQIKLDKLTPTDAYIIINTSDNHFYLYKGKQLIREGLCSTGKNEKLVSEKGDNTFYTPLGVRRVQRKQPNPVWAKPDWAFIEEGLPIPPPGHSSRFESGTLGAYKLELGNGYMIHGTIYKRFMGLSVTHGCIRLGDEDLEVVYSTMQIGSKVYIY
ncbi:MAG TPA: L,D-transpeptidase [Prolixibacteraceae bacterium]|nr:L,D-transpeptidase [Prolixibacteraceae bacterium]